MIDTYIFMQIFQKSHVLNVQFCQFFKIGVVDDISVLSIFDYICISEKQFVIYFKSNDRMPKPRCTRFEISFYAYIFSVLVVRANEN